jgi:DNA polymerase V
METSSYFDYSLEPRRAILFEDVKSNYASIECVQRNLHPLTTSLCVMSRAEHSSGLIPLQNLRKSLEKATWGVQENFPF